MRHSKLRYLTVVPAVLKKSSLPVLLWVLGLRYLPHFLSINARWEIIPNWFRISVPRYWAKLDHPGNGSSFVYLYNLVTRILFSWITGFRDIKLFFSLKEKFFSKVWKTVFYFRTTKMIFLPFCLKINFVIQ